MTFTWTDFAVIIPLVLQCAILLFAVLVDPYIAKHQRVTMIIISALVLSLIAQNCLDYVTSYPATLDFPRTIVVIYGYTIRPIIVLLFFYILNKERNYTFFWIIAGINAAVYLTALFSKTAFYIENGRFNRGPLSYTCYYVSGIMLVYLAYLTYKEIRRVPKRESLIPIFNIVLIIGSLIAEQKLNPALHMTSYLTMATVSCSLFYYIWLHLQFAREHERALLAEQRIQIMMTQIQPHFLYNTLSTIQALCRSNPEKAFETTEKFGTYLRQNIASLSQPNLIPVEKELEHTKIYTEIEELRFDNIKVIYDVNDTNFNIPALTIQPIVENAIKHGIRIREEGVVTVSINQKENSHEIIIEDNGKGFDTNIIKQSEGEHIGIRNVEERLRKMCGGKLSIDSKEGIGTKISIIIPK